MCNKSYIMLTMMLIVQSTCSSAAEESWHRLSGVEIKKLLNDQELGDGAHYIYRFRKDGVFTGVLMTKDVQGTWKIIENEFCWVWTKPSETEECYQVERSGEYIQMLSNGSAVILGQLNPHKTNR